MAVEAHFRKAKFSLLAWFLFSRRIRIKATDHLVHEVTQFAGSIMKTYIRLIFLFSTLLILATVSAEQVTKEQIKGLDEQVQDIKKDVLGISADLNQLEEKLLFPSNSQVSVFISLEKGAGLQPDAVRLKLDDKDVAHHIYSFKEVDALLAGGVQRIFTGNLRTGDHSVQVSVVGKSGGSKKTQTTTHTIYKGVGPQFVEIRLSGSGVEVKNW
jgi:hypothetical protein